MRREDEHDHGDAADEVDRLEGPAERQVELSEREMADAAARELGDSYLEAYGKGAGKVTAEFVGPDALVCFLEELEFQPNEEFLIAEGMGEQLIQTRRMFQQAIETTFRAAVERSTGRRVRNFNSIANIDPPMNIEIFMFEPQA